MTGWAWPREAAQARSADSSSTAARSLATRSGGKNGVSVAMVTSHGVRRPVEPGEHPGQGPGEARHRVGHYRQSVRGETLGIAVGVDGHRADLRAKAGDDALEEGAAVELDQALVAAAHAPGEAAGEDEAGDGGVLHRPSPCPLPAKSGERVHWVSPSPRPACGERVRVRGFPRCLSHPPLPCGGAGGLPPRPRPDRRRRRCVRHPTAPGTAARAPGR